MPIHDLVAHHISCHPDSGTSLELASQAMPVDDTAEQMIHAMKGSFFGRLSREHGSFDSEAEASPLAQGLDAYLADKLDFQALSRQLMQRLKELLDEDKQAFDGHAVFFAETNGEARAFYLLLAGHKSAFTIGSDLVIASTRYLDLGTSLFGVKVDVTEWLKNKHYAYLTLVPPHGNRRLGDSFNSLTGFKPGLDKTDNTETFLAGVEAFAQQVDSEHLDDYRKQVVSYCSEQEGRDAPVDLHALSRSIDGIDGDRFTQFMADYTPDSDQGLMVDRRSLRRYQKFAGREKDLAISFAASQLNNRVHYNPDKDSLSIDGIPRALREQLLKHLNK